MIGGLVQRLELTRGFFRIDERIDDRLLEQIRAHVMRAAERREHAVAREQLERAQVDFLVATHRVVEFSLRLRERRRVEHDQVVFGALPFLLV